MQHSLQIIASFNFLLLTGIIWYNRKKLDTAIFIFSFFLLGKGLTIASNLVLDSAAAQSNGSIYSGGILLNSFIFFYAPFLFLFAQSIIKGTLSIKDFRVHFVPFVLFLALNTFLTIHRYFTLPASFFESILWLRNNFVQLYFLQIIGYTAVSLWLIYKSESESTKYQNIFRWLKIILLVFILIWGVFLGSSITYTMMENPALSDFLVILGLILLVVLSNITLVMMFRSPEYFYNDLFSKPTNRPNTNLLRAKFDELCDMVSSQKLYQNPDLKIGDLSSMIGLSSRNTSQLIVTYHGGNFYDFINSYRINEAKKLLMKQEKNMTILTILYESGFNSKSVFNTTFKKIVGETPSAYRLNHTK